MGRERAGSRGYWRAWSSRARGRRDPGVDDLQGAGRSKMACGAAAAEEQVEIREPGVGLQLRVALVQYRALLCFAAEG
jgi:hypothetical protein